MGKLLKVWISQFNSFGIYEVDVFLAELKIRFSETKLKNLKELYPTKEDIIPYFMICLSMKKNRNYRKRGFLKDPELKVEVGNVGILKQTELLRFSRFRELRLIDSSPFIKPLKKIISLSEFLIAEDPEFKFLCQK
jgi:hypothetical protein